MVITLKNIGNFSCQEVFDQCVTHLLSQNRQCYDTDEGNCVFRLVNADGSVTRCAVGCFIPDSIYKTNFEDKCFGNIAEELMGGKMAHTTYELLRDLQTVHDFKEPPEWPEALEVLSNKHKLIFKGA